MSWSDSDKATKVHKLLNNGLLEPEDVTHQEFRLLRQHYPGTAGFIRAFFEVREEAIQAGEWSERHEPPDNSRRIKRYERGEGIIEVYDPDR